MILGVGFAFGQEAKLRKFDEQRIETYKSKEKYHYLREVDTNEQNSESGIGNLIESIFDFLTSAIGLVILAALLMALFYLAYRSKSLSKSKAKASIIQNFIDKEANNSLDYQTEYKKAKEGGNNYDAIRFLFFYLLQELSLRSLIQLHQDKTNREYLREMPSNLRSEFVFINTVFEVVCYGKQSPSKQMVEQAESQLRTLLTKADA